MAGGAREIVEETPGTPRESSQERDVFLRRDGRPVRARLRAVQPCDQRGRGDPQDDERRGGREAGLVPESRQQNYRKPAGGQQLAQGVAYVMVAQLADHFGGLPFQHLAMADETAVPHAPDGIERHPCLMGQESGGNHYARQFVQRAAPRLDGAFHAFRHAVQQRRQRGQNHRKRKQNAPHARRVRQRPGQQQQGHRRRRHQAAPQVVENAPAVDHRQRIRRALPIHGRHPGKSPLRDLPIAADPAMLTMAETCVVGRQSLEDFDVAGEGHADVRALDQVVTEKGLGRESVSQDGMKCPDVVNGFSVKDGIPE